MGIIDKIFKEYRPWGNFTSYAKNENVTVKIIEVKSKEILSLQSHMNRDELWIPLDDGLEFIIGDSIYRPKVGEHYVIERGIKHRAAAKDRDARFLEVSYGHFDESDETRYDDIYGRN